MELRLASVALTLLLAASPADAAVINVAASANGGVASQSSTLDGNGGTWGAQWVNDGQLTGNLQHTDLELQPWVQVSFNWVYAIERVVLFNRIDCCQDRASPLQLQLFRGDALVSGTTLNLGSNWNSFVAPFATPIEVDRVRVAAISSGAARYLHLREIEAYADTAVVPVPSSLVLMTAGAGMLALFRRRKASSPMSPAHRS
jgi:hypothetical protein